VNIIPEAIAQAEGIVRRLIAEAGPNPNKVPVGKKAGSEKTITPPKAANAPRAQSLQQSLPSATCYNIEAANKMRLFISFVSFAAYKKRKDL
jgi:hypothetical protein